MRRLVLALCLAAAPVLSFSLPASADEASDTVALARGLRAKRVKEVKFEAVKLDDLMKWLRVATGYNYYVKRDVLLKASIDPETVTATLTLSDVAVSTLLELVLEPHGLVAQPKGNIVFVTTKADAMGKPILVLYPISHLTYQKTDFHGRSMDLHPSDYHEEEEAEEVPVEDDPFLDPNHVVEMVKLMVDAPWDTDGWALSATKTFLSCRAPKVVQARVAVAIEIMAMFK